MPQTSTSCCRSAALGLWALLSKYIGIVICLMSWPCSTIPLKKSLVINEHEYFSAFSREIRLFQRPKSSNVLFGTPDLCISSHSASSPLQDRGRAISAAIEEHFRTLHFPHLNLRSLAWAQALHVPLLEQCIAGWGPRPHLPSARGAGCSGSQPPPAGASPQHYQVLPPWGARDRR